jgi:hypothetical protein
MGIKVPSPAAFAPADDLVGIIISANSAKISSPKKKKRNLVSFFDGFSNKTQL